MNILPKLLSVLTGGLLVATLATQTYGIECQSVYGGGQDCKQGQIDIRKEVWNPRTNSWVDERIDSTEHVFRAGNEMKYRLIVRNTSNEAKITDIKLEDKLPGEALSYITFQSASAGGHWDEGNRTVWFDHFDLDKQTETTREIIFKVKNEQDLPNGVACLVNRGEVHSNDGSDSDDANACIQKGEETKKQVLGITSLPSTGPALPMALALELVGLAGMGIAYLTVSRKYNR